MSKLKGAGSAFRSANSHLFVLMMLAWPAILEQFLLTLVRYIDTAMVGSLGAAATAAVAINSSPTWMISSLLSAVAVGYSVQVAHSIGAKDNEMTGQIVRQALLAVIAAGLVMTAVCLAISPFLPKWMGAQPEVVPDAGRYLQVYVLSLPFQASSATFSAILRCMGDTKTPLIFNTATNILNVILNYFLIFETRQVTYFGLTFIAPGAGWGVTGAAVATSISTTVVGICLALCTLCRRGTYCITLKDSFRPDRTIICRAAELGVPVAFEHAIVTAGQLVMTKITASLGTVALAAGHVAITAEALSYMPADGISYAATALVGQKFGAREYQESHKYGILSGWVGFFLSAFMGLLLFIFATPLAQIFSSDPEVIALAAKMLRIVALCEPLFGVSIVLSGALRGLGDTRFPLVVGVIGMWAVRATLAPLFVYVLHTGLAGAWYAMVCDLCVRGVLCTLRFKRFNFHQFEDAAPEEKTVQA